MRGGRKRQQQRAYSLLLAALSKGHRCACHARLLTPEYRCCGPARGMPFVRSTRIPVTRRKDFSFLDLPACFFRSREVKKLLGPLWA